MDDPQPVDLPDFGMNDLLPVDLPCFGMDDPLPVDLPDASLPTIASPHQSSAAASAELSLPTLSPGETDNLAVARTVSQTVVCDVVSVLAITRRILTQRHILASRMLPRLRGG